MAESYRFGYWGATSEEILKSHFPVHRACRDGDMESLALLLVENQQAIYTEDSFYGWTPAHWAAYFGKLSCLTRLHEAGSHVDLATLRLNQTPAHIAAFASKSHCLVRLIQAESDIERKQTPAHLSAFGGHPQCLLWLLQSGASVQAQDYLGETTVHKAARTGSIECISLLASHGANLSQCNNNRQSPAQLAAACGYAECARYIEAAAIRQDMQQQTREEESPSLPLSLTEVSPHDVTSVPKGASPCVINAGINGGKLPPPGAPAEHIPEEMEGCESQDNGACAGPLPNGFRHHDVRGSGDASSSLSRDITLHRGISSNMVPVGGRKRSREDDDEMDYKRIRTSVLPETSSEDIFSTDLIAFDREDEIGGMEGPLTDDDNMGCDYDYNGIPQFPDENSDPNPVTDAQNLECDLQAPTKCYALKDECSLEPYMNGHSIGSHGDGCHGGSEGVYPEQGMASPEEMCCQGGEVNHNSCGALSDWCRPPRNADGYVHEMGDDREAHSYGHLTIEVENTSNSALEHHRSIMLEQGYDSMLCCALE